MKRSGSRVEKCGTCRYWIEKKPVDCDWGLCRLHPTYVERLPTDWCGQYEIDKDPPIEELYPQAKPDTRDREMIL